MTALIRRVPDLGELFSVTDASGTQKYRVDGWLKSWSLPDRQEEGEGSSFSWLLQGIIDRANREFKVGEKRTRLVFCRRDEAEFIAGYGVCGITIPVADVVVEGVVPWSQAYLDHQRLMWENFVGEVVF